MEIIDTIWISESSEEAIVTIACGGVQLVCFWHPFNFDVVLPEVCYVFGLNIKNISRTASRNYSALKINSEEIPGYEIIGKVIDPERVKIGGFVLELDTPLPGDITVDEFVRFSCDRLSI